MICVNVANGGQATARIITLELSPSTLKPNQRRIRPSASGSVHDTCSHQKARVGVVSARNSVRGTRIGRQSLRTTLRKSCRRGDGLVARGSLGDSHPSDDHFRPGNSWDRNDDSQVDPSVLKWPRMDAVHPEMLPEEHKLYLDDFWEDGWYGVNTRWWTELSNYEHVETVSVLLFGVGTGQEGVYSLQRWREDGLPHDTVLAFASTRDAERYAAMLEEEMGRMAVVEPISPPDLKSFCTEAGFDIRVVDSSAVVLGLFAPPKQTVDVTDWERASRLRDGLWSVLTDSPKDSDDTTLIDSCTLTQEDLVKLVDMGMGEIANEAISMETVDTPELKDMKTYLQGLYDKL